MRCPNCSGERVVLASSPGEQPDRTCVCLGCAFLWDGPLQVHPATSVLGPSGS